MEKSKDAKQSVEFSAKTVEDALRQATDHFGVPTYRLDYEIARDSTRSILGIVRTGEVTIRAWIREPFRQPAVRLPSEREREEAEAPAESRAPAEEEAPTEVRPPAEIDQVPAEEAEETPEEEPEAEELEDEWEEEEEEAEDWDEEEEPEEVGLEVDMERNPPELEDQTMEVLTTLLDKMGILAAVEVVDKGGKVDRVSGEVSPLIVNVVGDDLGMLIGRRGETLRDLQFVSRLILSRRLGVWPNLVVDVEGYKARRIETLRSLAERMADQVRRTGRMVALEPMPAHERRIVHLALRADDDVYTESTGQEGSRKVQIIPKR